MAPAATVMVWLVLPAYIPSLPALFVLLPGVVVFGVTFVANGYLTGIDRVGVTSIVSVVSVVTNIIANLILIPLFGIVGAATASLISYSLSSVLLTIIASRLTETPFHRFWLPGPADIRFTAATTIAVLARLRRPAAALSGDPGS
jgi:O-antigen/teichoic acid export membrane protein